MRPAAITDHRITEAFPARPCVTPGCGVSTTWRAVYVYHHGEGTVELARCPVHLARFALHHRLELPKEIQK
jgi:hypothetical protein